MHVRAAVQRVALLLVGVAPCMAAQGVVSNGPQPMVPNSATVTIAGTFALVPATPALVQLAQQGALCNPGACYSGTATVRANQAWVAQVRVRPTAPSSFTTAWIAPGATQAVRLTTTFMAIASGSAPSTGSPLPLMFSAAKAQGRGGAVPSAAQLAGYLEFRVVGAP